MELVYATYHVDVGQTPFFVALDHKAKVIVVSIRGTQSMKDILTDLNAEYEVIPTDFRRDDWLGHKVRQATNQICNVVTILVTERERS